MSKIKIKCDYCGNIFEAYKSSRRGNKVFCSKKCESLSRIKRNKITIKENYAEIIVSSKKYGQKVALIDLDDVEKVKNYTWTLKNARGVFYIQSSTRKNGTLPLHRLIMNCPKDMMVDHIHHNTLDNRKFNLRICTLVENLQNKKSNTSGRAGVNWYKTKNKWQAQIQINGKKKNLGYFINFDDAVRARELAEQERIEE